MKIAVFCPPLLGHLYPTAVLGRALIARGHEVTVFQFEEFRKPVESQDLEFCPLGPVNGALARRLETIGRAQGLQSLKSAVAGARESAENICEYGPSALKEQSIELVLVDQNEPAGATVAEHLKIPFISLCPSLPLDREPAIPPPFVGWTYADTFQARLRNTIGYALADLLIAPINRTLNRYRENWKLAPIRKPDDSFSKLAQLSQLVSDLDFPRHFLPDSFHYLGPWLDLERKTAATFPLDRLDGRRTVYASFGTLQPGASKQFAQIAAACAKLNLQLILATGAACENLNDLPGNPIVVPFAPQLELIPKAEIVITHGGMNTVMHALRFGKPMLVLPQTHDQPAIAARLASAGAGVVVNFQSSESSRLERSISVLLSNSAYGSAARKLQASILRSGGRDKAVYVIENASVS